MKKPLKKLLSYYIPFSLFFLVGVHSNKHDANALSSADTQSSNKTKITSPYTYNDRNEIRAMTLTNLYVNKAVSGAQRIMQDKKHKNYVHAVQSELPGAPRTPGHTWHCLYGQSTQLNRALNELNDTIQIIPKTNNAHQASSTFIDQMTKLYSGPEYQNALYRGHLYVTRQEYERALNKYLRVNMRKTDATKANSLRAELTQKFAKNNFCATTLNPGTIIIVNSGHAVMYLGQGKVKNGDFIPDANGTAICCSYNAEHTAIELNTWPTSQAFAADIHNIAIVKYKKESELADSIAHAEAMEMFNIRNMFDRNLVNQR